MYFLIPVAIACWLIWKIPADGDYLVTFERIVRRLPASDYKALSPYTKEDGEKQGFWEASEGLAGLFRRQYASLLCVRIVQVYRKSGKVDWEDARMMVVMVLAQLVYTLLAIPEALVCLCVPVFRHIAALEAARFYCLINLRTETSCISEDAPECLLLLSKVL